MIYCASDHAGFELKGKLIAFAKSHLAQPVIDEGPFTSDSVDYPDFAEKISQRLFDDSSARGVLICGTGIGMSIAANRSTHIRAALCQAPEQASFARAHNNANVLCLGARVIDFETAARCFEVFMTQAFEGGRHQKRLEKLAPLLTNTHLHHSNPIVDRLTALEQEANDFGFVWADAEMIFNQIISECAEVKGALTTNESPTRVQEEIGDLIHASLSLCHFQGFAIDQTLSQIAIKFDHRLQGLKKCAADLGLTSLHGKSPEFMLDLWEKAKNS